MTMNNINNILVIKFKHIGDVLVTTPLFRNLRIHFPDARICASVIHNTVEMLSDNPDIDAIFPVNRRSGLWTQLRLIGELRRNRFDLVIDLSEGDRGAIVAFLTGSPCRLGYRRRRRKFMGRDLLFTDLMSSVDNDKHAVRYHLEPLRALGLPVKTEKMRLQWTDAVEEKVDRLLRERGLKEQPFVVVHPTSRWLFKSWTPEGNSAVIDFLRERCRLPVVVTGSDDPNELAVVKSIMRGVRAPVVDLAGQLTLKELASLIRKAVLFFGVDTAPMHIAAAVGTPVVALFGPSGDHMWGPWGHSHVVVSQPWDCRPCGRAGCNDSGSSRCLETIRVETVIDALSAKLRDLGFTPS